MYSIHIICNRSSVLKVKWPKFNIFEISSYSENDKHDDTQQPLHTKVEPNHQS